jgi:hypothetical protein
LKVTVVAELVVVVLTVAAVAEVIVAPPLAIVVLIIALPLAVEELYPYGAQKFNTSCNLSATVAFFALQHSSHYRQI